MRVPIINIRGTNGSGKSFLVQQWLQRQDAVPHPRRANLFGSATLLTIPTYYQLKDGGVVLGPYNVDCGGCDRMGTTEDVRNAILNARSRILQTRRPGYVIFEGVIISTVFQSWYEFSQKVGKMYWVYLDTPVEVCIQRVAERNKGAAINQQLIRDKVAAIESTRKRALEAREEVVSLHWENALFEFSTFMEELFK